MKRATVCPLDDDFLLSLSLPTIMCGQTSSKQEISGAFVLVKLATGTGKKETEREEMLGPLKYREDDGP